MSQVRPVETKTIGKQFRTKRLTIALLSLQRRNYDCTVSFTVYAIRHGLQVESLRRCVGGSQHQSLYRSREQKIRES